MALNTLETVKIIKPLNIFIKFKLDKQRVFTAQRQNALDLFYLVPPWYLSTFLSLSTLVAAITPGAFSSVGVQCHHKGRHKGKAVLCFKCPTLWCFSVLSSKPVPQEAGRITTRVCDHASGTYHSGATRQHRVIPYASLAHSKMTLGVPLPLQNGAIFMK